MADRNEFETVEVMQARSPMEAELIAQILEAAGIPALVEGRHLQDEFAMPQKMLGNVGVSVKVRKDQLEDAKQVLADARAAGEGEGEGDDQS